ncbi:sigma factor G inhibitor Gin [Caldalkalibacillus mannanilyticus]|uniref:sigma factor G inhibitor Gin n=1 Tax=Caldalkalibacillus mannanilyticus TaxID=1418 RepID=UPI0006850E0B|nr:sigma factor G inhibitor Gin [Caldalkalibacillus mannanilyticus]
MNQSELQIKKKQNTTCIVCSKEHHIGIHIWDHFICKECEGEMVSTDVVDEKYPFFIKQMRKIWLKENA